MAVKVTYVASSGVSRTLELEPGVSVMQAGLDAAVPEIESDCGGACSCASCHVYVDPDWLDRIPPMSMVENSLLGLLGDREPNSRLSCQIKASAELDGLVVRTLNLDTNE